MHYLLITDSLANGINSSLMKMLRETDIIIVIGFYIDRPGNYSLISLSNASPSAAYSNIYRCAYNKDKEDFQ